MERWFEKKPRLIQIILLLIPVVNWIIEIGVRWNHAVRKKSFFKYLIAIFVTVTGLFVGWLDCLWCLLFKHMIFCN